MYAGFFSSPPSSCKECGHEPEALTGQYNPELLKRLTEKFKHYKSLYFPSSYLPVLLLIWVAILVFIDLMTSLLYVVFIILLVPTIIGLLNALDLIIYIFRRLSPPIGFEFNGKVRIRQGIFSRVNLAKKEIFAVIAEDDEGKVAKPYKVTNSGVISLISLDGTIKSFKFNLGNDRRSINPVKNALSALQNSWKLAY